jgi:hypothetical protein
MRIPRGILIVVVVLGGLFLLLYSLQSRYLRFVGKDSAYFRQFAEACDLLLQQHPVGTNDWVYLSGGLPPENSIQLSGRDPSVPKVIRALDPERIIISSNRVWIGVGVGRGGFGIIWEQDRPPDGWGLHTSGEGLEKTHYETTKLQFHPGATNGLWPGAPDPAPKPQNDE